MDKKRIIKYFLQFVVIVLVGAGIFFGIGYYRYRTSPEYKKYQDLLALKERYMADTYGGDTPEETLQLFIDALKAGDIDLAAKYFVLDKQEKWLQNLVRLREKSMLTAMISDLNREKHRSELGEGMVFFEIANDNKEVALTINFGKSPNGKWKLLDL